MLHVIHSFVEYIVQVSLILLQTFLHFFSGILPQREGRNETETTGGRVSEEGQTQRTVGEAKGTTCKCNEVQTVYVHVHDYM